MASLLEKIKTGEETFTSAEIIQEEITRILSGLYAFQLFLPTDEQKQFISETRNSLTALRYTVYSLFNKD